MRRVVVFSALLLMSFIAGILWFHQPKANIDKLQFTQVQQGDLRQTVTANGTINPVNTVTVGTQVSGIIRHIAVDFNDEVAQGDVLATLDQALLQARVAASRAQMHKAQASLKLAQANFKRMHKLFEGNHMQQAEVDKADAELMLHQADLDAANTQLASDEILLSYAVITSPIAGIVISREIDMGQTVAADFQTPELFVIAEDLSQMQIEMNVSEADIGLIVEGQTVFFTVDAYPDEQFIGQIKQIRLSPKVESNVVTYKVIVSADNSRRLLLPGMTIFAQVQVAERTDTLFVDNDALRFTDTTQLAKYVNIDNECPAEAETCLYVWRDNRIHALAVRKGIETLFQTEIISDQLQAGDNVVTHTIG
jgi:HlyD family secretion protein